LKHQLDATVFVSTFIMAASREDADRQVQQHKALHPECGTTLSVMIGPTAGVAEL
jgi:hypothetical protein